MAVTRVVVHGGLGPRTGKGAAHHVVHTWRRRGAHVAATWQPRGWRDWMAPIYRPVDRTAEAARGHGSSWPDAHGTRQCGSTQRRRPAGSGGQRRRGDTDGGSGG
uniref:Uncharacterized protein K0098B12.29 n=1 Tax=Oryza sativa subsp. indica TaxID=39946 RepID=C8TF69_ORYSI|nr:hypothetical protein [Oryza sativa Indica Group]